MKKYFLKLYIAGKRPKVEQMISELYNICNEELKDQYELTIIDTLQNPQKAIMDNIIVTPTLIKELPLPIRRVIGDLSNKEKVKVMFDTKS